MDEDNLFADFILQEMVDDDLFDDKMLYRIIEIYKGWYEAGVVVNLKNFVYFEDLQISALAVSITNFPFELSSRWDEDSLNSTGFQPSLFENNYEDFMRIVTKDTEDLKQFAKSSKKDNELQVTSALNYLKLKKIKRLIEQNQKDYQVPHTSDEYLVLSQTHQHLKTLETSLLKIAGTVIIK